jgi:hypothetical protein
MKTLAITMAHDESWLELARLMAARFERLNGLPCRILGPEAFARFESPSHSDEDRKPTWLKAHLWDEVEPDVERLIWIDADSIPLRPLGPLPDAPFAARLDAGTVPEKALQMPEWSDLPFYFNSGFFVATRETRPAFERLKTLRHHPVKGPSGGEQSWLNHCIHRLLPPERIAILPSEISYMYVDGDVPPGAKMIHFAGLYHKRYETMRIFHQTLSVLGV